MSLASNREIVRATLTILEIFIRRTNDPETQAQIMSDLVEARSAAESRYGPNAEAQYDHMMYSALADYLSDPDRPIFEVIQGGRGVDPNP